VEELIKKSKLAEIQLCPSPALEILSAASLTIGAETCFLEIVGDFVRKSAMLCGHDEKTARTIELAVDEMVSNAIIHGYKYKPSEKVKIDALRIQDGLVIVLEEKGEKFDPITSFNPDINSPLSDRRIGGLGLFIVRKIADELYYEELPDNLKRFTFIKRIAVKA